MTISIGIGALLALAVIAGAHTPRDEQDASAQATTRSGDVTRLALDRGELGRFTLPVSLGRPIRLSDGIERDTVPLLLDTGANVSALPYQIALQIADADQLVPDLVGHALTDSFPTNRFLIEGFDFGLGAQDLEAAVLPVGVDSVLGAAGVLGLNALEGGRITLDFPNAHLEIGGETHVERHLGIDPTFGVIRGRARVPGIARPVNVLIDTGASGSIINPELARRAGRQATLFGLTMIYGVDGDGPQRSGRRHHVHGLRIGDLCMGAFWVSSADLYAFDLHGWNDQPAMIIGIDVLQHSRVEIDPATRAVSIEGVTEHGCGRRRGGQRS